ncbi:hypothetical protein RND81_02G123600 [Saponaria officinalis]|uniref:Uncharacterized protein n=1 Tax=Saponaria officinalis TaxID=3572 RepID=A0AAW1MSL2_SAPOF
MYDHPLIFPVVLTCRDMHFESLTYDSLSVIALQTVICFPCMGGVIELGSTELMSEDVELIERILKTSPELAKPVCSKISSSAPYSTEYDRNHLVDVLPSIDFTADHIFDTEIENVVHQSIVQNLNITSSDDCSIGWASPSQNKRLKGSTTSYGFVHRAVDTETGDDIHHSRGRLIRANGCSERLNSQEKNDFPSESQPYDLNLMHSISRNLTDNVPLYASEVERECEQFMILRSMVPSLTKTDEPSILSVVSPDKELDFGMDLEDSTPTNGFDKANEADIVQFIDVEMSSINDDVRVEMSCLWRDYLLLDIMKALHNLNLDTYTVQSSTFGGALFLSLKAKLRGAAFMSETMIKQALRRIINNC